MGCRAGNGAAVSGCKPSAKECHFHPAFEGDSFVGGPAAFVGDVCVPDREFFSGVQDGEWKVTKPDTDNLIKLFKDCMTRTHYWQDDAQVCSEITEKFFGERPGIYVRVEQIGEGDGR